MNIYRDKVPFFIDHKLNIVFDARFTLIYLIVSIWLGDLSVYFVIE